MRLGYRLADCEPQRLTDLSLDGRTIQALNYIGSHGKTLTQILSNDYITFACRSTSLVKQAQPEHFLVFYFQLSNCSLLQASSFVIARLHNKPSCARIPSL